MRFSVRHLIAALLFAALLATCPIPPLSAHEDTETLSPASPPEPRVRLVVTVEGLRNDRGNVAASLFDGPRGFPGDPNRAVRQAVVSIANRSATLTFDDLKPGPYALALLHDENKNGKLDTNLFGFPREGYGASNNPRPGKKAPSFDSARFVLPATPEEAHLTVRVIYLHLSDLAH